MMSLNHRFILIVSAACALTMSAAAAQAPAAAIDTTAIDSALGRCGQQQGDVYRVSFPRTDLKVAVKGLPLRAGFALGSWAAFEKAGSDSVVHGDLVLTESELDPVISSLFENGLEITAVHNHILEETPRVMYVHFWGRGDAVKLAGGLHTALAATGTPATASPAAAAAEDPDLHADVSQQHLGKTGAVRGGVLAISVPRPE